MKEDQIKVIKVRGTWLLLVRLARNRLKDNTVNMLSISLRKSQAPFLDLYNFQNVVRDSILEVLEKNPRHFSLNVSYYSVLRFEPCLPKERPLSSHPVNATRVCPENKFFRATL